MGREAHVARFALGRSAFKEPLRDENGGFVLGGQARKFDDAGYVQQWDERGHPQNLTSDRRSKRFFKAQNEILQACGVIVRKDKEKKRKRKGKEIPESIQLEKVNEENEIGFLLKHVDSLIGDLLTWWVQNLEKRLMTFDLPRPTMLEILKVGFLSDPITYLFGGFSCSAAAHIVAASRDPEFTDETQYANLLETPREVRTSWQSKLSHWSKSLCILCIEVPLEMISVLQQLGFVVGPALLACLRNFSSWHISMDTLLGTGAAEVSFASLIWLHLYRNFLHDEMFSRLYVSIRQLLPRPRNPTSVCISAADTDGYDSSKSIVGIGRPMGSATNRRFYGPQSFWPVFEASFPWVKIFTKSTIDKESIKEETLIRCAMMESGQGYHDMRPFVISSQRAENIINNLESLGVDVEEDFYVDIDQWSEEISFVDREKLFSDIQLDAQEAVNRDGDAEPASDFVGLEEILRDPGPGGLSLPTSAVSFTITQDSNGVVRIQYHYDNTDSSEREQIGNMESAQANPPPLLGSGGGQPNVAALDEPPLPSITMAILQNPAASSPPPPMPPTQATASTSNPQGPVTVGSGNGNGQLEREAPSTPEPGIRRARSLSHPQSTPRPLRRVTETENDDNVETYLAEVLDVSERAKAKRKAKDHRESRVTWLSVFAANSLAWHASSIIRSVILLPLDAMYYRKLARWFLSITDDMGLRTSILGKEDVYLAQSIWTWKQSRFLLLSLGVECMIRGAIWQVGCGIARYYGKKFHWGKF